MKNKLPDINKLKYSHANLKKCNHLWCISFSYAAVCDLCGKKIEYRYEET